MIATPASVFALEPPATASVASLKFEVKRLETVAVVTEPALVSSRSALSVALPDATGASFTAVTLWPRATVAELNAVVPPLVDTSTVAALVTVVLESINLTVRLGAGPLKFAAGTNLRLSVLFNVKEVEAPATFDRVFQVVPSDEYCHVPFVPSAV